MAVRITQSEKGSDVPYTGVCDDCFTRGRRGGFVKMKSTDSIGRRNWLKRHIKHQ